MGMKFMVKAKQSLGSLLSFSGVLAVVLLAAGLTVAISDILLEPCCNFRVFGGKIVLLGHVLAQVVEVQMATLPYPLPFP